MIKYKVILLHECGQTILADNLSEAQAIKYRDDHVYNYDDAQSLHISEYYERF